MMVRVHTTRRRPLGASKSLIDHRPAFRAYRSLFGAEDMHSHYRWAAVAPYIDFDADRTLEVGGGDGRISFEVVDHGHQGPIHITEFDPSLVSEAERIKARGGYDRVTVSQRDLRQLSADTTFDQVLAIDVLEHIDDDELAVQEIAAAMAPGARVVVSVPTPRYPTVFGRAFHEHLGHVRDGYWHEDLERLFTAAGLRPVAHRYYTGAWVSRACRLFYGVGIPYWVGVLWAPLVRPLLLRTERHASRDDACSVAFLAVKPVTA
jgi:SAM-dependent methyltransferase